MAMKVRKTSLQAKLEDDADNGMKSCPQEAASHQHFRRNGRV